MAIGGFHILPFTRHFNRPMTSLPSRGRHPLPIYRYPLCSSRGHEVSVAKHKRNVVSALSYLQAR